MKKIRAIAYLGEENKMWVDAQMLSGSTTIDNLVTAARQKPVLDGSLSDVLLQVKALIKRYGKGGYLPSVERAERGLNVK